MLGPTSIESWLLDHVLLMLMLKLKLRGGTSSDLLHLIRRWLHALQKLSEFFRQ